jgi:hypothetical protein
MGCSLLACCFDRTGPTPPGPFNVDIGSAQGLDMNAAGGGDTVNTPPLQTNSHVSDPRQDPPPSATAATSSRGGC